MEIVGKFTHGVKTNMKFNTQVDSLQGKLLVEDLFKPWADLALVVQRLDH